MDQHIEIRNMKRGDMDIAVEWAASEGWNPGVLDAGYFYDFDPSGYFMAFSGDEPVGSISAVAYEDSFGFIGLFIVKPEYRRKGIGTELGKAALRRLEGRNIGVDGVLSRVKDYEAYGFKLVYNNVRYEGVARPSGGAFLSLVKLEDVGFERLAAYDKSVFCFQRERFLRSWIVQPQGWAVGILDRGELAGYGVLRACRKGYKIGPLFADDPEAAEMIFLGLTARLPHGAVFYLDVPAPNSFALAMAEKYNMTPVFRTARMYNKEDIGAPIDKIFGVTSYELG